MSILKFELTDQHISLGKHMDIQTYFSRQAHIDRSLIEDEMYEEFGLILFGKPEGEFDPLSADEITWSDEQKQTMDKLFDEMGDALKILLQTGEFKVGSYKTKYHDINWKQIA